MEKKISDTVALAGNYFLTFDVNHKATKQGYVLGRIEQDYYLVQYFDWLMGEPTYRAIVSIYHLSSTAEDEDSYVFFENKDDMVEMLKNVKDQSSML